MKRFCLFVIFSILSFHDLMTQDMSGNVKVVYDACVSIRTAVASGSAPALCEANSILKSARIGHFGILKCISGESLSLDGHLVFDHEFIDSLLVSRNVYRFAQSYLDKSMRRGTSSADKVFMKTSCVKAFEALQYKFNAKGRQELALVTEPGGLVNFKVYDTRNDIWHNDDDDLNVGKSSHYRVFDIPEGVSGIVVEVINKTDEDISFVIISN